MIEAWKKITIFLLSFYTAARLTQQLLTVLLICFQFRSQWEATQIWWLWCSHEYHTKFWEFAYEEILAHNFNNFMFLISLHKYIIILKFAWTPWPDVHMNNLEKCFYHVLTNFILLHKNTNRNRNKTWLTISAWFHGFTVRS